VIYIVAAVLSVLSGGGVALLAAKWIAQKAVDHGLAVHLENHKAELQRQVIQSKAQIDADVATAQAKLEASLHRSNELMLGEEAAERAYRFEARKRLYSEVGPLRFQLIDASIRFRKRIRSFVREPYSTKIQGYFGRSLLYRIGRVLAVTELIERKIAHADFSVDPAMVILLRFRGQVFKALSSGDVPLDHPDVDWTNQREHIFRDQLPVIAVSMVVEDPMERVTRFDEFINHLDRDHGTYLQPLARLVDQFDLTRTPIFWLRLLAMSEACRGLLENEPVAEQLDNPRLDLRQLLALSGNAYLKDNEPRYLDALKSFSDVSAPATKARDIAQTVLKAPSGAEV